jgi:hypothetical protein
MSPDLQGSPMHSMRDRLRERPYAYLFGGVLLALAVPFMLRRQDWHTVYLPAARALWWGQDFYADLGALGYSYPPAMAFLALPVAFAPEFLSGAAWFLVNAVAFAVLCSAAWEITGGGRLTLSPPIGFAMRREHLVLLLGALCTFRFVTDSLDHQQTDLLVITLVVAGCRMVVRGRDLRAGALLGLAAGIKATPVIWVLYLLWRRKWAATGMLVAGAFVVNLLPNLIATPPGGGLWLSRWIGAIVTPLTGKDGDLGQWPTAPVYNQSLSGTLYRLITYRPVQENQRLVEARRAEPLLTHAERRGVLFGAQAAVFVGTLLGLAWGVRSDGSRGTTGAAAGDRRVDAALGFGVLLTGMVLLSPASSKPHFVACLVPALALARLAVVERCRSSGWFLSVAILLMFMSHRTILGNTVGYLWLWLGGVTWGTLALWMGCLAAIVCRGRFGAPGRTSDRRVPGPVSA